MRDEAVFTLELLDELAAQVGPPRHPPRFQGQGGEEYWLLCPDGLYGPEGAIQRWAPLQALGTVIDPDGGAA